MAMYLLHFRFADVAFAYLAQVGLQLVYVSLDVLIVHILEKKCEISLVLVQVVSDHDQTAVAPHGQQLQVVVFVVSASRYAEAQQERRKYPRQHPNLNYHNQFTCAHLLKTQVSADLLYHSILVPQQALPLIMR
jgi:hypothetical protein